MQYHVTYWILLERPKSSRWNTYNTSKLIMETRYWQNISVHISNDVLQLIKQKLFIDVIIVPETRRDLVSCSITIKSWFNYILDLFSGQANQLKICAKWGSSSSWSYGSCIYNYMFNQYLSPLKFWVRIPLLARCTR